jgi:hypothetical protein
MATQRAHRAFLAHRRAKQKGLLLPAPAAEPAECTNELSVAAPAPRYCTNELRLAHRLPEPDPLAALRARIRRLLEDADPANPDTCDLAAAIRAARLPGAAPYDGPIDLALLDRALEPFRFDAAAFGWLNGLARPESPDMRAA